MIRTHVLRHAALLLTCLPLTLVQAEEPDEPVAEPSNLSPELEPVTSLLTQKLFLRSGYGPDETRLGEDRRAFFSLRYEPSYRWYSPEQRWAKWEAFGRLWLNYDTDPNALQTIEGDNDDLSRRRHAYSEAREFYVRRNLLGDDPRFSATFGRQRFTDRFGIWWDDSIEALRLDYNDSFANGFVAVAEKFYYYNSDDNRLDPRDKNIRYLMAEYAWRWYADHWVGVRLLHEDDHSGSATDDRQDFDGLRYGLFLRGDTRQLTSLISDYQLELVRLDGKQEITQRNGLRDRSDKEGWALVGDIGKRFEDLPWTPRVGLTAGITDRPDDSGNDGFSLNRIQSDRRNDPFSYSSRLISNLVSVNLSNLAFYGVTLETQPTDRSQLDIRLSDLRLRNASAQLPLRTTNEGTVRDSGSSTHLGQVLDITHYWRMFPLAYEGKRIQLNTLTSLSYFRAGSALEIGDDYQLTLGITLTY
ncbi:alginate export family protein [Pseudomonas sp. NCHU5208]|uniref:alginate export family protein n=1 Tax=unclassified Pseudomonas TaxID=196821 RepID=UPI003F9AA152